MGDSKRPDRSRSVNAVMVVAGRQREGREPPCRMSFFCHSHAADRAISLRAIGQCGLGQSCLRSLPCSALRTATVIRKEYDRARLLCRRRQPDRGGMSYKSSAPGHEQDGWRTRHSHAECSLQGMHSINGAAVMDCMAVILAWTEMMVHLRHRSGLMPGRAWDPAQAPEALLYGLDNALGPL